MEKRNTILAVNTIKKLWMLHCYVSFNLALRVCILIYIYIYMYVYVFIYIYMCMYVYIYRLYIYIYRLYLYIYIYPQSDYITTSCPESNDFESCERMLDQQIHTFN